MNTVQHEKLAVSLRYWLLGNAEHDNRFHKTIEAFEYASTIHNGTRKDGITKEFYHQLNILAFLRTLCIYFENPALVLTVAILHDTYEDYPETHTYLQKNFPETFEYIKRVSKVHNGVKMPNDVYYTNMTNCVITVVVKAVDRLHNLSTMVGVFSQEKIKSYVDEVYDLFLPMIKTTKRNNPRYEAVLELLKTSLLLMVKSIESTITASESISSITTTEEHKTVSSFDGELKLYDGLSKRDNVFIPEKDVIYHYHGTDFKITFMYEGKAGIINLQTGEVSHHNLDGFYLEKSENSIGNIVS